MRDLSLAAVCLITGLVLLCVAFFVDCNGTLRCETRLVPVYWVDASVTQMAVTVCHNSAIRWEKPR